MNREQAKQLLPIIQAFADGETIQMQGTNGWNDLCGDCMSFNCGPESYRIKPKPLERWLVVDRDGEVTTHSTETEARIAMAARLGVRSPYRIVRMVEATQ